MIIYFDDYRAAKNDGLSKGAVTQSNIVHLSFIEVDSNESDLHEYEEMVTQRALQWAETISW